MRNDESQVARAERVTNFGVVSICRTVIASTSDSPTKQLEPRRRDNTAFFSNKTIGMHPVDGEGRPLRECIGLCCQGERDIGSCQGLLDFRSFPP